MRYTNSHSKVKTNYLSKLLNGEVLLSLSTIAVIFGFIDSEQGYYFLLVLPFVLGALILFYNYLVYNFLPIKNGMTMKKSQEEERKNRLKDGVAFLKDFKIYSEIVEYNEKGFEFLDKFKTDDEYVKYLQRMRKR